MAFANAESLGLRIVKTLLQYLKNVTTGIAKKIDLP